MFAEELISTNGITISSRAKGWTSKKSPVKVTVRQFYCLETEWNLKIQNCSQTRNPKVFSFEKTGNCGFQNRMCSLRSQPSHLYEWILETPGCGLRDTCHFSVPPAAPRVDKGHPSSATPSFSCQRSRRQLEFIAELPGLWASQVHD